MNQRTRLIVLVLLVVASVGLAGCSDGWSEDGPADANDDSEVNNSNEPEIEQDGDSDSSGESSSSNNNENDSVNADEGGDPEIDTGAKEDAERRERVRDAVRDAIQNNETNETHSDSASSSSENSSSDPIFDSDSRSDSDTNTDSDSATDTESDQSSTDTTQEQERQQQQDDRPTYTLTVETGQDGSMSRVPVTIERHSDGATTTRETTQDGTVEFNVYAGDYTVRGTDASGYTQEKEVTVDHKDTEVMLESLEPELPPQHELTITVVDQSGEPIEGASVSGEGETLPTGINSFIEEQETDANGQITTQAYEGHTYLVDAQYAGESSGAVQVQVTDEEQQSVEITVPVDQEGGEQSNYAAPDAVVVSAVQHDQTSSDLAVDTMTLTNTDRERPASLDDWTIESADSQPTSTLGSGTELAPGESRTIQLGPDSLDESGGTLSLYDGEGNLVDQRTYVGSPSKPPTGNSNETTA